MGGKFGVQRGQGAMRLALGQGRPLAVVMVGDRDCRADQGGGQLPVGFEHFRGRLGVEGLGDAEKIGAIAHQFQGVQRMLDGDGVGPGGGARHNQGAD